MQLFRWVHLIGMILFVGPGIAAGVVNRVAHDKPESLPETQALDHAQRELGRLCDGGAVLLFLSGLFLMWMEGIRFTALVHAGWLVVMIVCALAAAAMNGIAGARLKRQLADPAAAASAATMHAARMTLFKLRLGFLVTSVGAVICGVWRFNW